MTSSSSLQPLAGPPLSLSTTPVVQTKRERLARGLTSLLAFILVAMAQMTWWHTDGALRAGVAAGATFLYFRFDRRALGVVAAAIVLSRVALGGTVRNDVVDCCVSLVEVGALAGVLRFIPAGAQSLTVPRRFLVRVGTLGLYAAVCALGESLVTHAVSPLLDKANDHGVLGQVMNDFLPLLVASLVAAALISVNWRASGARRSLSGLTAALTVLAIGVGTLQVSIYVWNRQAAHTLSSGAQQATTALQSIISDDLNSFSARAATAPKITWRTTEAFQRATKPFLYGTYAVTAVAFFPLAATPNVHGFVVDQQGPDPMLSAVMGGSAADRQARRLILTTNSYILVGIRDVPGPTITPEPSLIVLAPQEGPHGVIGTLATAISLPAVLTQAVTTTGIQLPHVTYELTTGRTVLARILADDSARSQPSSREISSLTYGSQSINVVATPTSDFGLNLGHRSLYLGGEGLLTLILMAFVLQVASTRERSQLAIDERDQLLTAAITSASGILAIVNEHSNVVFANVAVRRDPQNGRTELEQVLPFRATRAMTDKIDALARGAVAGKRDTTQLVDASSGEHPQYFEVVATPLPVRLDNSALAMVIVRDVTELRTRNLRNAQYERLESLEGMARGLAHDFNNLLFIITGYLGQAIQQPSVREDGPTRTALEHATEAALRGSEIAGSLLTVAGGQRMQATRASVDEIVASLVPLAHQAIGDTRHFVVESSSNPMTMMVDVAQLTSAVVNLVINARDATDAGATITLRTDSVPASDAPGDVRPGDYVVFRVSDNGKGVDPTIASRIFDPYFTTKPRGSGSGLGLATVSSFARQSGGAITLDNHPGQGATFNLYIPLSAPDAPTDIATVAVAQSRRVLVVDDESPLGALLTSWLIDSGVEARFVSSPEAALREFKEFAPDTLLTDVQLGSAIDGRELASRLLFVDPDLKLVFMTGFSDDMSILQERGLAVLGKPFTRDELLEVLAVLPSNHKGAHPQ